MARNVLTMDADRQPQCETLEPENPPAQQESNLSTRQGRLPDGQAEENYALARGGLGPPPLPRSPLFLSSTGDAPA